MLRRWQRPGGLPLVSALLALILVGCGLPTPVPPTAGPRPTAPIPPTFPLPTPAPTRPVPVDYARALDTTANPLTSPTGLAVDAQGNLYIVDSGNDRIQKYDQAGKFVSKWGSSGRSDGQFDFRGPEGYGFIAVDAQGKVYVADAWRIQVFDSSGVFQRAMTVVDTSGAPTDNLGPVAVDARGTVYASVADSMRVIDASGADTGRLGGDGIGDGEFSPYSSVQAIDRQGNRFVVDRNNHRIQKLGPDGAFMLAWGMRGTSDGEFEDPTVLALDSKGNCYVTDAALVRVQKFDPSGKYQGEWSGLGVGGAAFKLPFGMAIDGQDTIYISDQQANAVYIFHWK